MFYLQTLTFVFREALVVRDLKDKVRRQNEIVLGLLDERTRAENRARSLSEALPVAEERRGRASAPPPRPPTASAS